MPTLELCEWCRAALAGTNVFRFDFGKRCCYARWLAQYPKAARAEKYRAIADGKGAGAANAVIADVNEWRRLMGVKE